MKKTAFCFVRPDVLLSNVMSELPTAGTREYALADALSRPNAVNGTYKKLNLPVQWENLKNKDAIYITHIVDLADELLAEAEKSGKDLSSRAVQKELQAAINGGMAGASFALFLHNLLRFIGFRK
jgi:hypothetical protein